MIRLALEYLFQKVFGDLLLIPGQSGSHGCGIVTAAPAPARRVQSPRPSLLCVRTGPRPPTRTKPVPAPCNLTGLHGVQLKSGRPDLDQIPSCAEPAEGHPRIAARDQHQLTAGSNLLDEQRENRAALLSRDDMHVIQHQHERIALAQVGGEEWEGDLIDPGHASR